MIGTQLINRGNRPGGVANCNQVPQKIQDAIDFYASLDVQTIIQALKQAIVRHIRKYGSLEGLEHISGTACSIPHSNIRQYLPDDYESAYQKIVIDQGGRVDLKGIQTTELSIGQVKLPTSTRIAGLNYYSDSDNAEIDFYPESSTDGDSQHQGGTLTLSVEQCLAAEICMAFSGMCFSACEARIIHNNPTESAGGNEDLCSAKVDANLRDCYACADYLLGELSRRLQQLVHAKNMNSAWRRLNSSGTASLRN